MTVKVSENAIDDAARFLAKNEDNLREKTERIVLNKAENSSKFREELGLKGVNPEKFETSEEVKEELDQQVHSYIDGLYEALESKGSENGIKKALEKELEKILRTRDKISIESSEDLGNALGEANTSHPIKHLIKGIGAAAVAGATFVISIGISWKMMSLHPGMMLGAYVPTLPLVAAGSLLISVAYDNLKKIPQLEKIIDLIRGLGKELKKLFN